MKKVKVRCYKCGNEFEVNEGVRSDICPACMSFLDIARAIESYGQAAAPSFPPEEPSRQTPCAVESSSAQSEAARAVSEPAPIAETGKETPAEETALSRAEKLLEAGIWSAAREKFAQVLQERECWQAHWGIVRAETRELTDLSRFSAVREHAEEAFSGMPAQERHILGARYVSQLNEQRRRTAQALKALEKESPPPQELQQKKRKSGLFYTGSAVFFIMLFIADLLLEFSGENVGLSVAGGLFILLDIVLLVSLIAVGATRFFKGQRTKRAAQAVEDTQREKHEAELKRLRVQLDDIDYLCGYLKY